MTTLLHKFLVLIAVALSSTLLIAMAEASPEKGYREIRLPSDARHRLCIPDGFEATGGKIDVLVHFHGSPQSVAASCQSAGLNCVVIGVSYSGLSSVYRKPFSANRQLFQEILDEALAELRSQPDIADSADWGTIAVSSFSAGFAAIREILKSDEYFERIDAVFLVDSLYSGYVGDGTSDVEHGVVHPGLMKDFLRFAQASAGGEKAMVVTHCCGPTPGYASTRETADYLLENLNLQAELIDREVQLPEIKPPSGRKFRMYRQANRGGFQLFGTPGDNVEDHVQHFRHMRYWLGLLPLKKLIDPRDAGPAPK